MSATNKAEIIAELEDMVVERLFRSQSWLADRETIYAVDRKLVQMGLVETVCVEPHTWRCTPLGKELDVDLLEVFMGLFDEWEVPGILEKYHLIDESEMNDLYERLADANADSVLREHVKRGYFNYRKATKSLH